MIYNVIVILACIFVAFRLVHDGQVYKSKLEVVTGLVLFLAIGIFITAVFGDN